VAHTQDHKRIYSWEHGLNASDNHILAAAKLATEFGWNWLLVSGELPDHSVAHVHCEGGWEIAGMREHLEKKAYGEIAKKFVK